MNPKKKNLILLLILLLIILFVVVVFAFLMDAGLLDGKKPSQSATPTTEETTSFTDPTPTEPEATTEETTLPVTDPTETTAETKPSKPSKPSTTVPPTTAPVTEPKPQTTDPGQILSLAKSKIKALSTDVKEVGSVTSPKKLTIQVKDTDTVQAAAEEILAKVKDAFAYKQSQADPNVAVGNPQPLTYEYNLTYVSSKDGKHTFLLDYRFISTSYEVTNQNYDTNQLVADVCAYLDGLGKVKYDSQTSGHASKQSVIVLMEHSYETALSIVKAQVKNASDKYRNYDFYYSALTVTTKGGVEQEALLFYIVNK